MKLPFPMLAKQLRFEQRLGDAGAIHCDEHPRGPRALRVDGGGDELLADAAVARDQHLRIGPRDRSISSASSRIASLLPMSGRAPLPYPLSLVISGTSILGSRYERCEAPPIFFTVALIAHGSRVAPVAKLVDVQSDGSHAGACCTPTGVPPAGLPYPRYRAKSAAIDLARFPIVRRSGCPMPAVQVSSCTRHGVSLADGQEAGSSNRTESPIQHPSESDEQRTRLSAPVCFPNVRSHGRPTVWAARTGRINVSGQRNHCSGVLEPS